MSFGVNFYGFKEFSDLLGKLPTNVQNNVCRTAVFRVAQQVRDQAKGNLQASGYMRTGDLYKSIKALRGRTKNGQVSAKIGSPKRYTHLIELGHAVHNGRNVLHVPGTPFLRSALYENKDKLLELIRESLVNELEKKYEKFGLGSLPPPLDGEEE